MTGFNIKETAQDSGLVLAVEGAVALGIFVMWGLYVLFRFGTFA